MNTFLRILYYIVTRLTALAIIVILIILSVFIGYDWANINVIVNDGLAQRSEAILDKVENAELNKFFTQEYLDKDILLSQNPYEDYDISNYDHRIKLKRLWVWPWETETKVYVEEIITHIEGNPKDAEEEKATIPPWESGEKIILMEKDGRWRIKNIVLMKPIKPVEKIKKTQNE